MLVVVGVVSGCVGAEDVMSPEESRDVLVESIAETAALIEGPGWVEDGEPSPQPCAVGGARGTKYAHGMWAPPQPDRDWLADVEKVAEYWESLGMDVRIVRSGPAVFGSGGSGAEHQFLDRSGQLLRVGDGVVWAGGRLQGQDLTCDTGMRGRCIESSRNRVARRSARHRLHEERA